MKRGGWIVRALLLLFCGAAVPVPAAVAARTLAQVAKESLVFITYSGVDIQSGAKKKEFGTGFVVSKNGLVLTAYHVVEAWKRQVDAKEDRDAAKARNPLMGYLRSVDARDPIRMEIVAFDEIADVAVLKLMAPDKYIITPLCLTAGLPEGTQIEAFGFPLAREFTPFPGTLSNQSGPEGRWNANFTNIEYGASGGPVYDPESRAVFGMVKGGLVRNIGSGRGDEAIPAAAISYVTPLIRVRTLLQDNGLRSSCGNAPSGYGETTVDVEQLRQIEELYARLLMIYAEKGWPATPFTLDTLSRRYEGQKPDHVGTDADGNFYYGAYRIQNGPNMQSFLAYLRMAASQFAEKLDRAGGDHGAADRSEAFVRAWLTLAGAPAFDQLQVKFIERTLYTRLSDRIRRPLRPQLGPAGLGLDISKRSLALRAVFFSIAVQYGPSTSLPFDALSAMAPLDGMSDREIIAALYKTRDNAALYFPQFPSSQFVAMIQARNNRELGDALYILATP